MDCRYLRLEIGVGIEKIATSTLGERNERSGPPVGVSVQEPSLKSPRPGEILRADLVPQVIDEGHARGVQCEGDLGQHCQEHIRLPGRRHAR